MSLDPRHRQRSFWPARWMRGALPVLLAGAVGCAGSAPGVDRATLESSAVDTARMPAALFSEQSPHWNEAAFDAGAEVPFDPHVRSGQLPNGLRWFVRQNDEPEHRAELRLVVNAGSIQEDEDQRGLAHFLEHMAFNGTEHFEKQELVSYLERIGMQFGPEINAYTSFDQTVYMLTIPTDSTGIVETAFQILADWSRRISLDPDEVTKERGVVLEEWRLRQGAGQRLQDETIPVLYYQSRYPDRLPIGLPEIIENATPEPLRRFYRDWYRPDLMAVIAVGDFDPGWVEQLIRRNFDEDWGPATPRPRETYDLPDHDRTLVHVATDPEATNSRVNVTVKLERERVNVVGDYRKGLVESLYTQMFNARLRELLQQEDPPFIGAFAGAGGLARTKDTLRMGATAESGRVPEALEAVLVEARRVQLHGFTETELRRAKARVERAVRRQYEERGNTRSASYAGALLGHFLDDAEVPGIEFRYELYDRLLPTIELAEINALERDYLQQHNRVILVTGPESEAVAMPTEEELLAVFDRVNAMQVEPYVDDVSDQPLMAEAPRPGRVVATETIEEIGVTRWTLENDVQVLVKPTDFKADEIQMRAFSWGGRSLGSTDYDFTHDFATVLVNAGGLGDFDAVTLQKKLAGKTASVNPYISLLDEGFTASCSPEDLELMLQLLHLNFTQPRKDPVAVSSLKQRYAGMLRNRRMNPGSAYSDTLRATLQRYHPWSRPVTSEAVESLDLDRAMEFYRERFADASDFTFIFVGNVELEELQAHVERYLGSLPDIGRGEMWRDVGIRYPDRRLHKVVRAGVDQKSQTFLLWHAPLREWSRRERHAINTLGEVLNIRLREVLREDLGGTYGVSVSASAQRDPYEQFVFRVGFGTDPARLQELIDEVFAVLGSVQSEGLDPDALEKVKESQRRDYQVGMQQNGYWLSSLEVREQWGIDQREILNTIEVIDALTLEDLQKVANHYLQATGPIRVDWLPGEGGGSR